MKPGFFQITLLFHNGGLKQVYSSFGCVGILSHFQSQTIVLKSRIVLIAFKKSTGQKMVADGEVVGIP